MSLRSFLFADSSRHESTGDTFGKVKTAKRGRTRDAEADFNQRERNRERGSREADTPRRSIFGRRDR
ncbi:hypothetical protein [Streptomyces sp. NBC_00207]|uniref:hypothetical protein n=1 Tax=unclassified Streptomyces TaxID=2593676 RepID=UPI00288644E0|nr:hypothetical protein [Streptomyces sp. DSM 41633]